MPGEKARERTDRECLPIIATTPKGKEVLQRTMLQSALPVNAESIEGALTKHWTAALCFFSANIKTQPSCEIVFAASAGVCKKDEDAFC